MLLLYADGVSIQQQHTEISLMKKLFSIIVNGYTMTLFTFIFSILYWGPSIQSVGMTIIVSILIGIGKLFVLLFTKKENIEKRNFISSLNSLGMAAGLQIFQFWAASPSRLAESLLPADLLDSIEVVHGRVIFVAAEHEIWLELKTSPEITDKLIVESQFTNKSYSTTSLFNFPGESGPAWFISKDSINRYTIYEYRHPQRDMLHMLFVSEDKTRVYYYYLDY
jgi:hypothetical protein